MNTTAPANADSDRELTLNRLLMAPRAALWRCWTEPQLIVQWFTPKPWQTTHAELDVRPGGSNYIVMRGPEGEEVPNRGVYLEVVPGERLVLTDAFVSAWVPSLKPFMVAEVTFADEAGGTRYIATARHWSAEDKTAHEEMGFHAGWNAAADQLEALAKTL